MENVSDINLSIQNKVLNQLFAAQTMLHVFPNETKLGEFIIQALMLIPGIESGFFCSRKSECRQNECFHNLLPISEHIKNIPDDKEHFLITVHKEKELIHFPLKTIKRTFGSIYVLIENRKNFEVFKNPVNNFINVVALDLENRWQKTHLDKYRFELEKLVESRTKELEKEIAEHRITETERKESEEKFRVLYNNSPDMYASVSSSDASIIQCNETLLKNMGYSSEEIIGSSIFKLYKESCLDEVKNVFQQILDTGEVSGKELVLKRKDGSSIDVNLKVNSVKDEEGNILYSISSWRDITEQKKSEELLMKSEEKFRVIFEQSPIALEIFNKEGILIEVNQQTLDMFGVTDKKYVLGFDLWSDPNLSNEEIEKLKKGEVVSISTDFDFEKVKENNLYPTSKSGIMHIDMYSIPLMLNNVITGYLVELIDISERRQFLKTLQERNAYIESIMGNMPIGFALNTISDGSVKYMNKNFEEIYGWSRDILTNTSIFFEKVFPDREYREKMKAKIISDMESGDPERMQWKDLKIVTSSNEVKYVHAYNIPIIEQNLMISTVQDITKRKIAEDDLIKAKDKAEESEEKYRMLYESNQMPISIFEADTLKFLSVNNAFVNKYGYTKEEFLNMTIIDIRPASETEKVKQSVKIIDKGLVNAGVFLHKKKNGEIIHVEIIRYDLIFEGKKSKLVFANDVTARIKTENELLQTNIELKSAMDQAKESDRLKSAFLANMSHEIRTPMNGILGFSELLKEPNLSGEEQRKYIDIIENSGSRMLNIINDIIEISKIESGTMNITMKETNINNLMDYILTFFKPEALLKKLDLELSSFLSNKETIVRTDSDKLYAVLINLVKNAIKYTDKGSITFGCKKVGDFLEFFVKDTGIGIAKERQNPVFERFVQADITDVQARQGAGLGLSISKAFVEMLGGKIWVESELGEGSSFYFTIKHNELSELKTENKNIESKTNDFKKINLKILIAEDDETSCQFLSLILQDIGTEIIIAKNGIEAVNKCRLIPDIDVVLMDINMPDLDGYEASQQIRQFNREIIIIAQTAYGLSGDKEKAINAGCNDYISKPINRNLLNELLLKYFN